VPSALAKAGTPLEIEIRGNRAAATVVAKPFFRNAVCPGMGLVALFAQ
jgi:glycine cleavage system aminomethyltransferase T